MARQRFTGGHRARTDATLPVPPQRADLLSTNAPAGTQGERRDVEDSMPLAHHGETDPPGQHRAQDPTSHGTGAASGHDAVVHPFRKQEPRSNTRTPIKKTRRRGNARRTGQNLVVRGVRRDPPDIHKLAQVVASLAADMLEDETGDEHSVLADTDTSDTATAAAQRKPRRAA